MAAAKVEVKGSEMRLNHLDFVRLLAINAAVIVSNLYDYAKQNSGPLKSTVGTVENAVTAVVGPVYEKFKDVPGDILVYLDTKVDEATVKVNECVPPWAKKAARKTQSVIHKASKVAHDLVKEAQVSGPRAAIVHAGAMSKDFAVSQSAVAWYKVHDYPVLHGVAEQAIPAAAHWSEKYNRLVKNLTKGYTVFSYLPLVPVEEMAKAYKQVEASADKRGETADKRGESADKKGESADKKGESSSSSESESDKEE